jgi:hypothetical protein
MLATIVKFIGGMVSKEVIVDIFKEVLMEFAVDLLSEFVKSTENKYDDQLLEKFKEFLDNRE